MSALNGGLKPYFHDMSVVSTGMLSVVSVCLPGPNVSPNSPRYTNCTVCDSRTMSCAPFLISLSSSGYRNDSVSRESSVHSMTSRSWPLTKSIKPIVEVLYLHPTMADASVLHCPNCGAPAAPGDHTCKFCQATLATVSCPKCFALMFDGAAYCPSCGARRARTEEGDRKGRCSACFGLMREVQIGDTGLMECEKCHAMWIDTATFEHICADRDTQSAMLGKY